LIEIENRKFSSAIKNLTRCSFNIFLVRLAKEVLKFDKTVSENLFKYFHEFHEIVLEIKKISIAELSACHYTSLTVADKIIMSDQNRLRFYNVVYMNDPEEGNILLDILDDNLVDFFRQGKNEKEQNVYLGSFLPAESEDELVMWRTYGKEKGEEAKGCSITINSNFFDKTLTTLDSENNQLLYKVVYINRKNGKIIGDNAEDYNSKIETLHSKFIRISNLLNSRKLRDDEHKLIVSKIINLSLSEILYLFKSADYSYENELRLIIIAPMESEIVKFDNSQFPKRLYIDSKRPIKEYIDKVVLGPKVENPSHWIYLKASLKKEEKDVEFGISTCKFR
jgi:hypothetical protein